MHIRDMYNPECMKKTSLDGIFFDVRQSLIFIWSTIQITMITSNYSLYGYQHVKNKCIPIVISSSVCSLPMHSNRNSVSVFDKLRCALDKSATTQFKYNIQIISIIYILHCTVIRWLVVHLHHQFYLNHKWTPYLLSFITLSETSKH